MDITDDETTFLNKLTNHNLHYHKTENKYEWYDFHSINGRTLLELKTRKYTTNDFKEIYLNKSKLALAELFLMNNDADNIVFIFELTDETYYLIYELGDFLTFKTTTSYNQTVALIPLERCKKSFNSLIQYLRNK